MSRGGRTPVVLMLIASLLLAGVAQRLAQRQRSRVLDSQGTAAASAGSGLGGMDSFALALLLGGLRGPLVMFLWSSSETQKNQKDLEDFDTKVEWIRLLQPEFDSVHIYQIWNKAYNISVQMASVANKYLTILDAVDYAMSVDRQRPDNINILAQAAQVYFDKLGRAQEHPYYRKRVRQETRALSEEEAARPTLKRSDPGWRRLRMDPLLDQQGNLLPELYRPLRPRPANLPASESWNDGSPLQYLKPFEPFPYGVSPFALAYNYHKRAQVLQSTAGQKHIQFGPALIDSRPGLDLQYWAREEIDLARQAELTAFGRAQPNDVVELPMASAGIAPSATLVDAGARDEAIFGYGRAVRLTQESAVEYERHMKSFPATFDVYLLHMEELRALGQLVQADHDYLKAWSASGAQREAMMQTARAGYQQATTTYQWMALRTYLQDRLLASAMPPRFSRANYRDMPPELLAPVLSKVRLLIQNAYRGANPYEADVAEYEVAIQRAGQRLQMLERPLASADGGGMAGSTGR